MSKRQISIQISTFCDLRPDPPPPSHVPYDYIVEAPFQGIGARIIGKGGRKRREINDRARLADFRVLYTTDGRCLFQLIGSKTAIATGLSEISKVVYRLSWHAWYPHEHAKLRPSADWTRWSDALAKRLDGAWLKDHYSGGSEPARSSRGVPRGSSLETLRAATPRPVERSTSAANPSEQHSAPRQTRASSITSDGRPSTRANWDEGRESGVRSTSAPRNRRLDSRSPSLAKQAASISRTSRSPSRGQSSVLSRSRSVSPSESQRSRGRSPVPRRASSSESADASESLVIEYVAFLSCERSSGAGADTACPGNSVSFELIGRFVGPKSVVPFIELMSGAALKVEVTTSSARIFIEGGDVKEARELVGDVVYKATTGGKSDPSSPRVSRVC